MATNHPSSQSGAADSVKSSGPGGVDVLFANLSPDYLGILRSGWALEDHRVAAPKQSAAQAQVGTTILKMVSKF